MRYLIITLLSFLLTIPVSQAQEAPPADHVVLISIDGFRPDFYLEANRPAPMLQQMAREGAHAKGVRGVFPSVTYPSHTTLVTGARPANHSIHFNRDPEEGWNFFFENITAPTLWELVAENGGTTVNVGWPVTVVAPIDYNVVISGALSNSDLADDPIRELTTPEGLFEELEREATGRLDVNYDLSNSNPAKEGRVAEMASYLIAEHAPQLLSGALQVTDSFQHRYGREAPEVDRALVAADRAVARIMEELDRHDLLEQTAFVISGDHGFSNIHLRVQPNAWLAEAGLYDANDSQSSRARFETSGGAAFLYLADPDDTEAIDTITELLDTLPRRRPVGSACLTATSSTRSVPTRRRRWHSRPWTGSRSAAVSTVGSSARPRAAPMATCPTSPI
ncbi:MAG: sulfatase-like hydrolase/transferase [Bacteroidetes bacterium]|jgi:predicted AlkP superfamily pyrophosphatase or phosphodiesterase|nr:sulfatase-like hydrolase/transferase [Bacteroidota bacterium]